MRSEKFKPSSRLQDILGTIDWERDTFELVYLTFSKLTGQALDQTREDAVYPADVPQLSERCSWDYFGESELGIELRRALTLGANIADSRTLLVSAGPKSAKSGVISIQSGEYRSCVLAVEASQLVAVYNGTGDALFSLNIRNFLGNTKNNQRIIGTAREHPENFFYFNNGISCVAETIEVFPDRVNVTKLQVINGAQTVKGLVRSAGKLGKAASWDKHQPLILVRVTEVGSYGKGGSFREEITRFNNTQNVIKDADFKSNDSVQRDLVDKFSNIARPGRRVVYQAKRTDIRPAGAEVVRMEEFSKIIFAFLGDPVSFSGSTSMLFDDDKGYSVVFGDGKSPWSAMPNDEFKLRAGIFWIGSAFGNEIKDEKKTTADPILKVALERKWFPIFAARLLLERAYPDGAWRAKVAHLYKGDWKIGEGGDGKWVEMLYELSKQLVLLVYRMAAKTDGFVHRNWMRSDATVEALRDAAQDFAEFQIVPLRA